MGNEMMGKLSKKRSNNSRSQGVFENKSEPEEKRVIGPGFNGQVYSVVRKIPLGRVSTYGDIATILGSPRVARQVGFALAALKEDDIPWQRVINARGTISGKSDTIRARLQRQLLEEEGVKFDANGRIDLNVFRWND